MSLKCSECGAEHDSLDDFEHETVQEVETDEDGSISVYGKTDLYLCKDCRKAMGVGHSN